MLRILPLLLLLIVARLHAQSSTETVDTPEGRCQVWTLTTSTSTFAREASYNRCALDRQPVLLPGAPMPPTPRFSGFAGGTFRIVVNADGSVDPDLSSAARRFGHDEEAHGRILATLKQWRFAPGVRAGVPVRSSFDMEVVTDPFRAADTLPARHQWRYVTDGARDSLVGRWVMGEVMPPFQPEQEDSVHAAMLRRMAAMGVVRPTENRTYCLSSPDTGAAASSRLARVGNAVRRQIPGLTVNECVDTPERVRLLLRRVHQTENGRAVVYVAGSQLPRWPTGFDGRAWARWSGGCVGYVRGREPVDISCDVSPDVPKAERQSWYDELGRPGSPARAPRYDSEPLHLTVLATMSGAYGIDTVSTMVSPVPRLRDAVVRDSVGACNYWSAWAPGDSSAYVVHGDPSERDLHITRANFGPAVREVAPIPPCGATSSRPDRFVAFLIGGIGERPRGPVTLCIGSCARHYVLDPRYHLIAERPHARVSVAALREMSQHPRGALQLRVLVDPAPADLVPLVIIADSSGNTLWASVLRDQGGGVWDWDIHYSGVYKWTLHALVYLLRR